MDQVKDIGTFEGVAAGEDEDGHLHGGDLIDQGFAFVRAELVGMRDGLGGSAAMLAGQITGLRDFPDGQKRSFIEIQPAAGGNAVHWLHGASVGIAANLIRENLKPCPGYQSKRGENRDAVLRKAAPKPLRL